MTDEVPLGVIADRLESIGHPGPAAAVRTLEFVLSLEKACSLGSILDHAYIRLRDDHKPEMTDSLRSAVARLQERIDDMDGAIWESFGRARERRWPANPYPDVDAFPYRGPTRKGL